MPKLICYFQLSHLPKNLSQSIITDLPLPGMLKYYLASVSTIPQKMTSELENIRDSVQYTLLLLIFENNIWNNRGIFLFDNLLSLPGQDKKKESI